MKKILLLLLFVPIFGFAQHFEWLQTPETIMPYNPDLVGYSTAADTEGNIYYSGFKDTPYIYNSIMGSLYLNKYDADGSLLFSKTIGGQAQSHNMVTDSNGNLYVALSYVGSISVDNIVLATVNQSELYLLAKFNPQGNLIWYQELIPADMGDNWYNEISGFNAMAIDAQDNLYIGYADFFKSYIEKRDADGGILQTTTQDDVSRITSIAVDSENNIYAAGSCIGAQANFSGTPVNSNFPYSIYLAKYNAVQELQWVKIVEDVTCSAPHVVAKTPDAVYFSAPLFGAFAFDDFTAEEGTGSEQYFLTKLNAQGQYQWLRQTPPNSRFVLGNRNFLSLDNAGNVYLSGSTSGTINWGNNITTSIQSYSSRGTVVKYDVQGTVQMAKIAGGNDNEICISRFDGQTITDDGAIFTAGMAFGNADFDGISYSPGQDTAYYPFITKISQIAAGTGSFDAAALSLYPNPASDKIFINGLTSVITGRIINTLGQKVLDITIAPQKGTDISALPAGTYIIKADGVKAIKFIKS